MVRKRKGEDQSVGVVLSMEHLIVKDAPTMEGLLAHDINWGLSINVVYAPRL